MTCLGSWLSWKSTSRAKLRNDSIDRVTTAFIYFHTISIGYEMILTSYINRLTKILSYLVGFINVNAQ